MASGRTQPMLGLAALEFLDACGFLRFARPYPAELDSVRVSTAHCSTRAPGRCGATRAAASRTNTGGCDGVPGLRRIQAEGADRGRRSADHRPARGDCDVTQPVISFLMGPEMLRGIERRVEFAAVLPGVSSLTAGGA